jgi:hypothetical protein
MAKILTRDELTAILSAVKGATFSTITTRTEPKLLKTNNPFIGIRKVSRVNVTIGFNYQNSVNNQREREGSEADFESLPRKWGQRIKGTPLVSHNGNMYLEAKVEKSLDHMYINAQGQNVPDDLIAPFLPKHGETRQDLEKEIILRDYKIDSIIAIKMNGEEYTVA